MGAAGGARGLIQRMQAAGRLDQGNTRELIGESHALEWSAAPSPSASRHGIRSGEHDRSGRRHHPALRRHVAPCATRPSRSSSPATPAVAWSEDEEDVVGQAGIGFLMRQAACIGGGTTEMSRNVISERVLGMPRERTVDRDIPFRDVPRSAPSR